MRGYLDDQFDRFPGIVRKDNCRIKELKKSDRESWTFCHGYGEVSHKGNLEVRMEYMVANVKRGRFWIKGFGIAGINNIGKHFFLSEVFSEEITKLVSLI